MHWYHFLILSGRNHSARSHTGELGVKSHSAFLTFSLTRTHARTTKHTYKQRHSTWICAARSGLIATVTRDTVPVGQWAFCSSVLFGWSGTSDRTLASVLKNNDWDSTQSLWHLIEGRSLSLRSQSKGHSLMLINSLGWGGKKKKSPIEVLFGWKNMPLRGYISQVTNNRCSCITTLWSVVC